MLETLKRRAARKGFRTIETIVGTPVEPLLPKEGLDLVLMLATIKFVDQPVELLNNIALSLKPEGRFILIEMEDDKAADFSGNPVHGVYRSRQGYLDLFARTAFRVDQIDGSSVRHHAVFILAVKKKTLFPTSLIPAAVAPRNR